LIRTGGTLYETDKDNIGAVLYEVVQVKLKLQIEIKQLSGKIKITDRNKTVVR
jgi:hypothetical protein